MPLGAPLTGLHSFSACHASYSPAPPHGRLPLLPLLIYFHLVAGTYGPSRERTSGPNFFVIYDLDLQLAGDRAKGPWRCGTPSRRTGRWGRSCCGRRNGGTPVCRARNRPGRRAWSNYLLYVPLRLLGLRCSYHSNNLPPIPIRCRAYHGHRTDFFALNLQVGVAYLRCSDKPH